MPTADDFVPLIDLDGWYHGDAGARAAVAAAVDRAACNSGFLLVVNHGVPEQLRQQFRAALGEFFAQPDEVKARYATTVDGNGWSQVGTVATAYSEGTDTPPDLKEGFIYGEGAVPDGLAEFADLFPPNRWPVEVPELAALGVAWAAHMHRLKDDLIDVFAAALGLPDGALREHNDNALWSLNCNLYPGAETTGDPQPGQFRIGPHTDFGVLTVLDREPGLGGLQVQRLDGEWVDAPFVPGALTVNLGDLSVRWTGGRWQSARHRVLPPPHGAPAERLVSLVYFHEGNPDAVVAPLPGIGDADSFEPVRGGDHLRRQLAAIVLGAAS